MGDKKIVLAIDDVSMNLLIIRDILSKHFDVRLAKSGELALYILGSVKVDLILLDIEMPGMSGFDFLEVIKDIQNVKDIPIMFVTSHATVDFITRASKAGVKDYIIKPLDSTVLLKKVSQALDIKL